VPGFTNNYGFTLPVGGDAVSELRLSITAIANQLDGYSLLSSLASAPTSVTASRGETLVASAGVTVTSPAAVAESVFVVVASAGVTGASPVTVSAASGKFYGLGLGGSGASSFPLGAPGAYAVCQSDGTNWYLIGGQQDSGWVALSSSSAVSGINASLTVSTGSVRALGDRVFLKGELTAGGSIAVGATLWDFALAYRPPNSNAGSMPCVTITSGGTVAASSLTASPVTGVVSLTTALVANQSVFIEGLSYSLS
jgi:hypothetical protein